MYFSKSSDCCALGSLRIVARRPIRSSATTEGGTAFGTQVGPWVEVQFVVCLPASNRYIVRPSGESTAAVRKPVVTSPSPARSNNFPLAPSAVGRRGAVAERAQDVAGPRVGRDDRGGRSVVQSEVDDVVRGVRRSRRRGLLTSRVW